jgi:hypothetical protein
VVARGGDWPVTSLLRCGVIHRRKDQETAGLPAVERAATGVWNGPGERQRKERIRWERSGSGRGRGFNIVTHVSTAKMVSSYHGVYSFVFASIYIAAITDFVLQLKATTTNEMTIFQEHLLTFVTTFSHLHLQAF